MKNLFHLGWAMLALAASGAHARTALQDRIFAEPMAHTRIAPVGRPLKVHYVRLAIDPNAYRQGENLLTLVRAGVEVCMEANRLTGRPSNPPREFPATLRPVHVDSYYAPNRQIQYTRDYTVRVKPDCSLEEGESFTATLDSLSGHCEIDMLARTAKGQCPVNGFASAPPFHVSTAAQDRQVREEMLRMAHMPGMAAMIAMTNNTAAPGATRRILGIECEEVNMPAMYTRACSAKGGSFPRPHTMILDGAWGEYKSVASEAKLDALLTNAIFTPYVAGGFSITSGNEN